MTSKSHSDGHDDTGISTPVGAEFDISSVTNLIGLWDFTAGNEDADTGLADGVAQDGEFEGNAYASGNALVLDGSRDYFDTTGQDTPFDMASGTVEVRFMQEDHVGSSPDSIVSRGEYDDRDDEGYFGIEVSKDGVVSATHTSGDASLSVSTQSGFFSEGDDVRVTYSWDEDGTGSFVVENLTTDETYETDFDSTGLTMDVGDSDDENFTFGAREYDDGKYDHFFNGEISYVAIYEAPVADDASDGIVEGTDGDDLIDVDYDEDPDGDMIDNADAILDGAESEDDLVIAGAGEDTVFAGEGDDVVYGDGGATENLLVNGDLESGQADGTYSQGGTLEGWDASAGTFETWGDGHESEFSQDGGTYIELDVSGGVDGIYQDVETVEDATYTISVDAMQRVEGSDDQVEVYFGGELVGTITPGDEWETYTFEVTGSGEDRLELSEIASQNDNKGPLLDNVSLTGASVSGDDDTLNGGNGDDVLFGEGGDDTLNGDAGNDTLFGGEGDDDLNGGDGHDIINDTNGSDTVDGGSGDDIIDVSGANSGPSSLADLISDPSSLLDAALDDTPFPTTAYDDANPSDDIDYVDGGTGNDTIYTGDDADTIYGGGGNDTIYSGIDDDYVDGGSGNDTIIDIQGADYVEGGSGDDYINVGYDTFSDYEGDDPNLPNPAYPYASDQNTQDGADEVHGGSGNDTILTGDDSDTIYGGSGNDVIDAGIDDDYVEGGSGSDTIAGGHGSDTIYGGDGDDYIDASDVNGVMNYTDESDDTDLVPTNDIDFVDGGAGNDTIIGGDDNDTLLGGEGTDLIYGGIDDDTITGGDGADTIYGGADADTIIGGTAGDFVDAGEAGDDSDTLDLTGAGPVNIIYDDLNPENGIVEFLDSEGGVTGTMTFENVETVIPCFTPGTLVATPLGPRLVEELKVGDKVITRDNGMQEIRWVGHKDLSVTDLMLRNDLHPILIREGALGKGLPDRDMMVSPNHRMLISSQKAALYFEDTEVLVAAKHLTGMDGVEQKTVNSLKYIHLMFDRHEVILADGTWSESFQPGDYTLAGVGDEQRDEIFTLFPELREKSGRNEFSAARRILRKHEADLLVS